jgi:hypothetical protein
MHSAFTPFVACCRQNYGELQGAVDNRKTSCLSKVLEDGRLGPSAKAIPRVNIVAVNNRDASIAGGISACNALPAPYRCPSGALASDNA